MSRLSDAASRTLRWALLGTALVPLFVVPGVLEAASTGRAVLLRLLVTAGLLAGLWRVTRRDGVAALPSPAPGGGGPLFGRLVAALRRDPFLWAFGAFFVVEALAALAGASPHRSFHGTLERMGGVVTTGYLLLLFVLCRRGFGEEDWDDFFAVWLGVGVVVGLYGALQALGGERLAGWIYGAGSGKATALLGNRGFLGAYAVATLAVAGIAWSRTEATGRRLLAAAAGATSAWLIYLTASRALVLGCAMGLATGAVLWVRWRGGRQLGRVVLVLVAAAIAAGSLFLLPRDAGIFRELPALERITERPLEARSLRMRLHAWRAGAAGVAERPLLGAGPENFHVLHHRHFDPAEYPLADRPERASARPGVFDRAHNAYLEAFATSGVAGGALFLALWALLFAGVARARRRGRLGDAGAAATAGGLAALAVWLVFWFLSTTTWLAVVALAAFLWADAPGGRGGEAESAGPASVDGAAGGSRRSLPAGLEARFGSPRAARRTLRAGALVAAVLLSAAAGLVAYQEGVKVLTSGREAVASGTEEDAWAASARYQAALAMGPSHHPDVARVFARHLAGLSGWMALRSRRDRGARVQSEAFLASGLAALDDAVAVEPATVELYGHRYQLARAAYAITRSDRYMRRARESARRALALSPGRLRFRHYLADLHVLEGRPGRAIAVLDSALAVYDGYGETYKARARARWAAGDTAGAVADLHGAFRREYAPSGAGFLLEVGRGLEETGRHGEAARLYLAYLALKYPRLQRPELSSPGRAGFYSLADRPLAYHLPLVLLRAGRRDESVWHARRLLALLEARGREGEPLEALTRFVRDVEAGETAAWEDAWSVTHRPPGLGGEGR